MSDVNSSAQAGDRRLPTLSNALAIAADPGASESEVAMAADFLVSWGQIDRADPLLARLRGVPAYAALVRRLEAAARQLRRSGILTELEVLRQAGTEFGSREVQIARHPGAKRVVIVFTAIDPRFWLSLMLLHVYLRRLGAHVIYLSDFRGFVFLDGLSVAPGYDALLKLLRTTVSDLGAESVHILAMCAGGFAGLRYGIDLNAESLLGMSVRTTLAEDSTIPLGGYFKRPELRNAAPNMMVDLKPFLAASGYPRRIMLYTGANNPVDPHHARHIASLPNVEMTLIPNHATHDVVSVLVGRGVFEQVLQRMIDPAIPRPAGFP